MIFLDANFIIALSVKKHDNYERAVEIWENIKNKENQRFSNLKNKFQIKKK